MMVNILDSFAKERGCKNAYQFQKKTKMNQATAYRLFNNRDAYPSKENQEMICRAFDEQPIFLRYVPDEEYEQWLEEYNQESSE